MPLRVNPFKKTCVTLNAFFSVSLTVRAICEVICILQIACWWTVPEGWTRQIAHTVGREARRVFHPTASFTTPCNWDRRVWFFFCLIGISALTARRDTCNAAFLKAYSETPCCFFSSLFVWRAPLPLCREWRGGVRIPPFASCKCQRYMSVWQMPQAWIFQ